MGVSVPRRHTVLVLTTFVAIASIARIGHRPIDSYIYREEQERRYLSRPEGGSDAGGSIGRPTHDPGNTAPRRSFMDPSSPLFDLVQRWNASSVTEEDAVQVLNGIVSSDEYINHKPSQGILFIKTHKTGGWKGGKLACFSMCMFQLLRLLTGSSTVSAALRSLATQHKLKHPGKRRYSLIYADLTLT